MNSYEIWCNLVPGASDQEFCRDLKSYLDHLQEAGWIVGWRLRRRKLGLGPAELGEFNITIEVRNLVQLEACFDQVARRTGEVDRLHRAVYSKVRDLRTALYRDYPDPVFGRSE